MKIVFETKSHYTEVLPQPKPAGKFIPDWYKNLSNNITDVKLDKYTLDDGELFNNMTIKKCIPVRDALTSGYIIPLWSDMAVKRDSESTHFTWQTSRDDDEQLMNLQGHSEAQFQNTPLVKNTIGGAVWKFESPWKIITPPGYSCIITHPLYHENYFEILPGVVDTDTMHEIHYPFKFNGPIGTYNVPAGTPLVQIIPFKRDDWTSEIRANDNIDRVMKARFSQKLSNVYRNFYHSKKTYR